MKLKSIDVHILRTDLPIHFPTGPIEDSFCLKVTCSPQEAFNLIMMPAFSGLITSLVPNYEVDNCELPEVPEKED